MEQGRELEYAEHENQGELFDLLESMKWDWNRILHFMDKEVAPKFQELVDYMVENTLLEGPLDQETIVFVEEYEREVGRRLVHESNIDWYEDMIARAQEVINALEYTRVEKLKKSVGESFGSEKMQSSAYKWLLRRYDAVSNTIKSFKLKFDPDLFDEIEKLKEVPYADDLLFAKVKQHIETFSDTQHSFRRYEKERQKETVVEDQWNKYIVEVKPDEYYEIKIQKLLAQMWKESYALEDGYEKKLRLKQEAAYIKEIMSQTRLSDGSTDLSY